MNVHECRRTLAIPRLAVHMPAAITAPTGGERWTASPSALVVAAIAPPQPLAAAT